MKKTILSLSILLFITGNVFSAGSSGGDDNAKTAEHRFETYTKETLPILRYYKEQKILKEIDGTREINEIYDEICSIITTLET